MDIRATRRAAEKAARSLINDRAALVGELAVALAERAQLNEDADVAGERGRQLIAAAEAEADALLEAVRAQVLDVEQRYATLYTAATAAGWSPADLTALGFSPGRGAPRGRRAHSGDRGPARPQAAPGPVTVPQQHSQVDT